MMKKIILSNIFLLFILNSFLSAQNINFSEITNFDNPAVKKSVNETVTTPMFIRGNFVEIGVHTAGSFGSDRNQAVPAGYHPTGTMNTSNLILGFACDHQKDGWEAGSPAFMGDYFVPGAPVEGWGVEWNIGNDSRNFLNYGAIADWYNLPVFYSVHNTQFFKIETAQKKQVVWIGEAINGEEKLRIKQTVNLGLNDTYFTVEMVLTNIGTVALDSVEYFRCVDPDNEQRWTGVYRTNSYVIAQPHTGNNNDTALVASRGYVYNAPLILGTLDERAQVSTEGNMEMGEVITDPDEILESPNMPNINEPLSGDYQLGLAFRLGKLEPAECATFTFFYNMEDVAVNEVYFPLTADYTYNYDSEEAKYLFANNSWGSGVTAISELYWDFDSDGVFDATGDSVFHALPCPANHEITLTVELCNGERYSVKKIIPLEEVFAEIIAPEVVCFGDSANLITEYSGGSENFISFLWASENAALSSLTTDSTTFYAQNEGLFEISFLVIDANGCSATDIVNVLVPPKIETELLAVDILCFGDSSGTISQTSSGGFLPLEFLWSNNETTQNIENLPAGKYFIPIAWN